MSILGHNCSEINSGKLEDKSKTKKERPWRVHKKNSQLLSESYARIGKDKKALRVGVCGEFLQFAACPKGHEKFLRRSNFCGLRLCPMCGWRKSLKVSHQVKKVAHYASKGLKIRWLFLTLTCRNVEGHELISQLDEFSKSWQRLLKTKDLQNNILGFFRATEVTRDADYYITEERYIKGKKHYDRIGAEVGDLNVNFNSYHPHYHVVLAVQPSYFGKNYIKIEDWVKAWRKAMRVDYDPIVDIRTVKAKRNIDKENQILEEQKNAINDEFLPSSAVAELSKYVTKAGDFLLADNKIDTDEAVQILDASLRGRKLFAYGGVLKDVYDYLRKNGETEDVESDKADLVHTDDQDTKNCKCSVCESTFLEEIYSWMPKKKSYYLTYRD